MAKLHIRWMHESLEGPLDEVEVYNVHDVIVVDDQLFVNPTAGETRLDQSYWMDHIAEWWVKP